MNRVREIIRKRQKKMGITKQELSHRVGWSVKTIYRIEKGEKVLSDKEAEIFAKQLDLDPEQLKLAFDEIRTAHAISAHPFSGEFADYLRQTDRHLYTLEKLRMKGLPQDVFDEVQISIDELRSFLKTVKRGDRLALQGLLVKALVIRAIAYTMILPEDDLQAQSRLDFYLAEINDLSPFLKDDLGHFRDMAKILPAMRDYLSKKWGPAENWLKEHLLEVEGPYIRGLGIRDQVVIAGKTGKPEAYKNAVDQATGMLNKGLLNLIDQARLLEGKAQAAIFLLPSSKSKDVEDILEEAEKTYIEAKLRGEDRPSIEAQIARTKLLYLVTFHPQDENQILEATKIAVGLFKTGGFGRYLNQTKKLLKETKSKNLLDFCASL